MNQNTNFLCCEQPYRLPFPTGATSFLLVKCHQDYRTTPRRICLPLVICIHSTTCGSPHLTAFSCQLFQDTRGSLVITRYTRIHCADRWEVWLFTTLPHAQTARWKPFDKPIRGACIWTKRFWPANKLTVINLLLSVDAGHVVLDCVARQHGN